MPPPIFPPRVGADLPCVRSNPTNPIIKRIFPTDEATPTNIKIAPMSTKYHVNTSYIASFNCPLLISI